MAAWGIGDNVAAAKTMAPGAQVTYGRRMALNTPGLTDFGTQKVDQDQAVKLLAKIAEVYDFYNVIFVSSGSAF